MRSLQRFSLDGLFSSGAKWTKKLIQIVLQPLLSGVKESGLHPSRWMDDTSIGEEFYDSRVMLAAGGFLG
jgi:hypothetical protein